MSIQKKSLISTLQSAKKANIAREHVGTEAGTKTVALKASPVRKLAGKSSLAMKAANKSNLATKAALKSSAALKLSHKR